MTIYIIFREFGELNVTRCELGGLDAALKDNTYEGSEYKGVKVHFKMDDSGVLKADSAEAVFEKSPELVEQEESAFSAFGKKLSGLFGGGGDKKDAEKLDKDDDDSEAKEEDKEEEQKHKEEKKSNEKKEKKSNEKKEKAEKEKEESKKKEEKKTEKDEKKKAEESSNDKKEGEKDSKNKDDKKSDGDKKNDTTADKATNETAKNETAKEEEKPKVPKSLKVPLTLDVWFMDMPNITDDEFGESLKKLKHFDDLEKAKRDREEAQNAIESFVFETSDKLEQDEYRQLVSDEEYEAIKKVLTETNTWLEDEAGFDTSTQEFKDRLKEAKTITKDLFYRHDQAKDRPKAEEAMKQMLNYSRVFLSGMKNLTEEQQIFTDVEIETLEKLVNKTEDWWTEKSKAQTELKSHEKPAYTITEAAEKINALDREVKYLINKAKITPRKTKDKASNTTKTDDGTSANNTTSSTTTSDEDDSSTADGAPESDDAVPPISDETVEQNETPEDDTIAAADDSDASAGNDNASSSNDNDDNNSEQEVAGEDDDDYKSAKDAHEDL